MALWHSNFTLPLQNRHCIEVVCPLDHPVTEQTHWGKAVSKKAQEGGSWLTWVFATEDISKVEEKFGRSAIEGHRTCPDGSDLKWKQTRVNEITDSREIPFFIRWLTTDYPSRWKAVAAIMKITIADTDHLSDSWFKTEILGGLNGAVIEFIDTLANDVNMELNKSNGIVDSMGNILRGLPVVGIRIERSQLESSNSQKVLIPQSCVLFLD